MGKPRVLYTGPLLPPPKTFKYSQAIQEFRAFGGSHFGPVTVLADSSTGCTRSYRLKTPHMTTAALPLGRRPFTIVMAAALLALEAVIALGYAALEGGQGRMGRGAPRG